MIRYLKNLDEKMASEILTVQLLSYQIEAELIGFTGIPQLKDTVETILTSKEVFIGYQLDQEWGGFLSYSIEEVRVDICRLVVHPDHFRKGIARKLVETILDLAGGKKVIVSTGAKNQPALNLYKSFGFDVVNEMKASSGVVLSLLEKKAKPVK